MDPSIVHALQRSHATCVFFQTTTVYPEDHLCFMLPTTGRLRTNTYPQPAQPIIITNLQSRLLSDNVESPRVGCFCRTNRSKSNGQCTEKFQSGRWLTKVSRNIVVCAVRVYVCVCVCRTKRIGWNDRSTTTAVILRPRFFIFVERNVPQ